MSEGMPVADMAYRFGVPFDVMRDRVIEFGR